MGIVMMILATVGGVLGAVGIGLLKDEAAAWTPHLNRLILRAALSRIPAESRERYAEEWAAHINEYPGKLSQLLQSTRFLWASFALEVIPEDIATRRMTYAAIVAFISFPIISYTDPYAAGSGVLHYLLAFAHFNAFVANIWAGIELIRVRRHVFPASGSAR